MTRVGSLALLLLACACGGDGETKKAPSGPHPGLLDPSLAREQAPSTFRVRLQTTKGDIVVEAVRKWAPRGVDRFYNLVRIGYFRDVAFHRVIPGFMAQFGFAWDPRINRAWRTANIADEPVRQRNRRGVLTMAQTQSPDTRSTQFFINTKNNRHLDGNFPGIGMVIEGLEVVDRLYAGYGEQPNRSGIGPGGVEALKRYYPKLDYIKKATLLD